MARLSTLAALATLALLALALVADARVLLQGWCCSAVSLCFHRLSFIYVHCSRPPSFAAKHDSIQLEHCIVSLQAGGRCARWVAYGWSQLVLR